MMRDCSPQSRELLIWNLLGFLILCDVEPYFAYTLLCLKNLYPTLVPPRTFLLIHDHTSKKLNISNVERIFISSN
uniref:Uncharacterized protein n=1 Tax=Gossypium raimondii TaxID=29730 RepID=A0A0D2SAG3_GOSRA|nr:hypothetical protein B456_009G296200 [Gossypium raimondii]